MDLAFRIMSQRMSDEEIALFWFGQAGFLLIDNKGRQLVIDPYLTDCGERIKGFKRISAKVISPSDLCPDVYVITHEHFDHLDYDAVPIIAACSNTVFCGSPTSMTILNGMGVSERRTIALTAGQTVKIKGFELTATYADHGEDIPDAIGLFVKINGCRCYFSGDTAYRPNRIKEVTDLRPNVAILSINGEFGNLNAHEGALVARDIGVKIAIPCHYWTFIEHGGDPMKFIEEIKSNVPGCLPLCIQQGEAVILNCNNFD